MRKAFPYIIVGLLILFSLHQCEARKEAEKRVSEAVAHDAKAVKYFKNKLGTVTAKNKALLLNEKELKASLSDTVKKLTSSMRNIKAVAGIKVVNRLKIDTVYFDRIVEAGKPCDGTFERKGAVFTKFYEFGYKITNSSLVIEPFSTSSDLTLAIGERRKWFLGKSELVAEVTSSNPTWEVTKIDVVVGNKNKRFYDTRLFNIGIGAVFGYYLGKQ